MREIKKLPIIMLPNVVFFPHTSLPLYVVDEVYEELIEDAIANNTPVGVALSVEENQYDSEFPTPNSVCGIGRPLILERMDDGVLKVLMRGIGKARLLEKEQEEPYPMYWAEIIHEERELLKTSYMKIERLKVILEEWLSDNVTNELERNQFLATMSTNNHVIDYVATFLIKDKNIRQLLLDNDSYDEKVNLLNVLIKDYLPFQEDAFVSEAVKEFESIEKISKFAN